jgi:hypothetical protein
MQPTMTPSAPLIQGVASPDVTMDPQSFYPATRRLRFPARSATAIGGFGTTDSVQLRQTGIVAGLELRVKGTITFGSVIAGTSMSYLWPLGLARQIRVSANGQSNLINCRAITIRALEFLRNARINDSGITKNFGGAPFSSGTLALSCDDWGTGPTSTDGLAPGTDVDTAEEYSVDLTWFVPIAADDISLVGSVYAQTAATNLTLDIDWETQANLLTLGGGATVEQALTYEVVLVAYSIPNVGGRFVVPDLSHFHQLAESRAPGLGSGVNEPILAGTGVGRRLLRLLFQVYSGTPPVPLAMTDANFSTVGWAYGGSDVPESYQAGGGLRALNERQASADLGRLWGIGAWDFASQFSLRDVVDESMTSDLRILIGLVASPTAGVAQIAQETLFAAPVGA